ncbi:hypothetical protein [Paenibacillus sp. FSL W7-1287]|uniref:hypothetical protein n=1 Tax=Paenibacillus sp. FSL W7-1287 TaxID=2954538 RepID=UPI0030F65625
MYGSWRWNLGFGIFGLLAVFFIGLSNNPWAVSLLRGGYACIAFFLLAYPLRYILGLLLSTNEAPVIDEVQDEDEQALSGNTVNYVTPDSEEDLNALLRDQLAPGSSEEKFEPLANNEKTEQFKPLNPTKLVSTDNIQAEQLTKAVRHLTGE